MRTVSIFILMLVFSPFLLFQDAHAEIQLGMNGQLHSSFQTGGKSGENFHLDRAWLGFDAYTPKGFAKLNLQLNKLDETTNEDNAVPVPIREAYTGMKISTGWRFMLGLKNVPHGMLQYDHNNIIGIDNAHYRMGLKQATGLHLQYRTSRWRYDIGIFNPAYRALFVSTTSQVVESLSAPLFATRLSYQVGKLLNIQGSIAIQEYDNNSTLQQTFYATQYYDFGFDIDFSPRWGMYYNYSQVEHAYGLRSADSRTASLIQFDWTSNRFWQLYTRATEVFDKNTESQLLLHVGVVYTADKHNRLLISANLGSNNEKYSGFLGEQKQSFILQYQFNF